MTGIAITTYDNLPLLKRCVGDIRKFTPPGEYQLLVAADGAVQEIIDWLNEEEILYVTGERAGCARGKNRALLFWERMPEERRWDVLILMEDDVVPMAPDWMQTWRAAAFKWRHITWCHDPAWADRCTVEAPCVGAAASGPVAAMTFDFFQKIGFNDPDFYASSPEEGWACEDLDWLRRVAQIETGAEKVDSEHICKTIRSLAFGLQHATMPEKVGLATEAGVANHVRIFKEKEGDPVYRLPWRNEEEKAEIEAEVESAIRLYRPAIELRPELRPASETFRLIAPIGTQELQASFKGRIEKKPWDYEVTVAIPHLDTLESLQVSLALLRLQTWKPYLMVIDTGSPPAVREQLEAMRAEDCEIHFVGAHAYRHSSQPVVVALDLAQALCRTKLLFHTHSDCFMRRPDFVESYCRMCNANTPVIGYRMSPRDWATRDWAWMVGHTVVFLYMPSIHRVGATWSMERMHYAFNYPFFQCGGWPDTEVGFNCALRDAGIKPVFIGYDRNYERQVDDNIDHARSYPGSKIYRKDYHVNAAKWMVSALSEGRDRLAQWSRADVVNSPERAISPQTTPYYAPS